MTRTYPQWFIDELVNEEDKQQAGNGVLSTNKKVQFRCHIHGLYEQVVKSHIKVSTGERVCGCPKCGIKRSTDRGRTFPQWFVDALVNEFDKEKARIGSLTTRENVELRCDVHGTYVATVGNQVRISTGEKLRGCPKCAKPKTFPQWFINMLVHKEDIERIKSGELTYNSVVELNCSRHGIFTKSVSDLLAVSTGRRKSIGCPKCAYEQRMRTFRSNRQKVRQFPQWFIDQLVNEDDKQRAREANLVVSDIVEFKCDTHGPYKQMVGNHIYLASGLPKHSCPKCFHGNYRSGVEKEIEQFLRPLIGGKRIELSARGLIKDVSGHWMELDLYLPDYNLAIEVNGSYYHQTFDNTESLGRVQSKDKMYHQTKFLKCQEQGIHLVQIFDVDWIKNQDKIKGYLKGLVIPKVNFYGRSLVKRRIPLSEANEFCCKYHLQGGSKLATVAYALVYGQAIMAVATFGPARFTRDKGVRELHRYCVKPGISIPGGLARMMAMYEKEQTPEVLISYSDNDYFSGDIYRRLGFENRGVTTPSYYWFTKSDVKLREETQPKKLKDKYPELYEEAVELGVGIEDHIMRTLGYGKVHRSGNQKWVKRYNTLK